VVTSHIVGIPIILTDCSVDIDGVCDIVVIIAGDCLARSISWMFDLFDEKHDFKSPRKPMFLDLPEWISCRLMLRKI
jgi:hypothetical protein